MRITVEIEVTYDQNAFNEQSEANRIIGLDQEEIKGAIGGALLECGGIENLAGVEVNKITFTPTVLTQSEARERVV